MEDRLTTVFQWMRKTLDQEHTWTALRSRVCPREAVTRRAREDDVPARELALPALYGRYGVLPDYFTDELLLQDESDNAMRTFLDIFNRRVFGAMFQAWQHHELFLEDALDPESAPGENEAFLFRRIAGQLASASLPRHIKGLRWNRMDLYRGGVRTSAGVLSLVRAFFPDLEIELETFVAVERKIPEDQRPVMGKAPITLGAEGNLLTGTSIRDPRGGFRLVFRNLTYADFSKLLPGGGEDSWRPLLESLVTDYTRGTPSCLVRLALRADQIPTARFGSQRMGRDLFLVSRARIEPFLVDAGRF